MRKARECWVWWSRKAPCAVYGKLTPLIRGCYHPGRWVLMREVKPRRAARKRGKCGGDTGGHGLVGVDAARRAR